MNKSELTEFVHETVLNALNQNQESTTKAIAEGLEWEDGWEKTTSRMVVNSLRFSVELSVQTVMALLAECDIINIDKTTQPPKLKVIRGNLDKNFQDTP